MGDDHDPGHGLTDDDLAEIEQRLQLAVVALAPWKPSLETRWATGGSTTTEARPDHPRQLHDSGRPLSPQQSIHREINKGGHRHRRRVSEELR